MAIIVKSFTFSPGAIILSSEHNTNFDTLYNLVNGNIDNSNIKTDAGIASSKIDLSSVDINGGTIDGTTIGLTTPSSVAATTLKVGTTNQGDILYDNGTSIVRLPPSTDGYYLKTQGIGANPAWVAPPTNGVEYFTSSGTFTAPEGVTKVWVYVQGGGGGGGQNQDADGGAGGGGSGAFTYTYRFPYPVTPLAEYAVIVGAGGTTGVDTNGGNGGKSSFDTVLYANGGTGGNQTGAPGVGGTALAITSAGVGADAVLTAKGNGGAKGSYHSSIAGANGGEGASGGGGGGGTYFGAGGNGGNTYQDGEDAPVANSGAGGGGSGQENTSSPTGGLGAAGFVLVVY